VIEVDYYKVSPLLVQVEWRTTRVANSRCESCVSWVTAEWTQCSVPCVEVGLLFSRLKRFTMGKITQEKLRSWERLIPKLGEREAAEALGHSQGGMRAARHRSLAPEPRKDRRGAKKKISTALGKKIRRLRDKVNRQGGHPTAKFIKRKLKIRGAGIRSIQRQLGVDNAKYRNRPTGKYVTADERLARVQHCCRRLQEKFVYKGPKSARGPRRGIDCWLDCHTVDMPLEKAPKRSRKSWCHFVRNL